LNEFAGRLVNRGLFFNDISLLICQQIFRSS